MRWFSFFLSLALPLGALAAKKSDPGEVFDDFFAKSRTATPVKLADASYNKLTSAPRDYSVAVLLTALDNRYGCQLCREFGPEYDLLARNWIRGDKKGASRLVFGILDFSDGRDTFLSLGLQTAPVLLFFPPTTGEHAVANPEPIRYDFGSGPQIAELVHEWIARQLPDRPHPTFKRPINYTLWAVSIVTTLGVAGVVIKLWPYLLPFVQNRNIWAAISLIAVLMFTSGHMFNTIRKVPYVAADGRGGVSYFAGGFQNQFGLETQIIAGIYGILSFAIITLALRAPRIAEPKMQQITVIAWGGVLFLVYGFLLSIFRVKNGGYPFALPPFY